MVLKTSEISNVAFSIFGLDIYWYAILIVAAIILGILWCKKNDGRYYGSIAGKCYCIRKCKFEYNV